MRTPALILMGFSAIAAVAVGGQAAGVSESGTWSDPEKGKFVIEGICDVTAEKVGCWNFDGKPNSSLTTEVRDFLTKEHPSFEFRVGLKNRYLVTNWSPAVGDSHSIGVTGPLRPPTFRMGTLSGSSPMPGRSLVPVTSPMAAGSLEASFKLSVPQKDKTFKIKLEKGAKTTIDDMSIEVVKIEKAVPEALSSLMLRNIGLKQAWKIHVKAENVRLNFLEMKGPRTTKDGKAFRFVDEHGNPDPDAKPPIKPTMAPMPHFSLGRDIKTGQMWFETNVNPDKVESFEITPRNPGEETIQFKGIPADPLPNGSVNR